MGFAVVADEVRTLAQRSAEAARDTAALIEESISRAEQGSTKLGQVQDAITAITSNAQDVKGLVDGMSIAARQQTDGIEQVRSALTSMEQTSQRTAALAEEAAAASEELAAQSEARGSRRRAWRSWPAAETAAPVEAAVEQERCRQRSVAGGCAAPALRRPSPRGLKPALYTDRRAEASASASNQARFHARRPAHQDSPADRRRSGRRLGGPKAAPTART